MITGITGTLIDCNGIAVTNGYAVLTSGINVFFPSLNSSGQFSANIGNCSTASNITIEGFDNTNLQTSGLLTFTTTNPLTNVGSLSACNTVAEYITYTIDSNPVTSFFAPITCADTTFGANASVEIYANSGNDNFYLSIEDNVVGAYNFMDYGTSTAGAYLSASNANINTSGGNPNIVFNLNAHGAVGGYVDVTFSGTYLDLNSVSHTISGNIHVIRDL